MDLHCYLSQSSPIQGFLSAYYGCVDGGADRVDTFP